MKKNEIEIVKTILEALTVLPRDKREYLIGYAEGVVAMNERRQAEEISQLN